MLRVPSVHFRPAYRSLRIESKAIVFNPTKSTRNCNHLRHNSSLLASVVAASSAQRWLQVCSWSCSCRFLASRYACIGFLAFLVFSSSLFHDLIARFTHFHAHLVGVRFLQLLGEFRNRLFRVLSILSFDEYHPVTNALIWGSIGHQNVLG